MKTLLKQVQKYNWQFFVYPNTENVLKKLKHEFNEDGTTVEM